MNRISHPCRRIPAAWRTWARLLLAAGMLAAGDACLSDGPSTETGNPNLEGTLLDAQGKPAPGEVALFRVAVKAPADTVDQSALVPPVLIKTLEVGADGRFRFDSLPAAHYAVEGADAAGKRFALVAGLIVAGAKETLQRAVTLKPPARLLGRVTRGPNALPAGIADNGGIVVRVGGLDRFAYSDTAGYFALENVPEGIYRLAFAAPDGHYEPKFLDSVRAVPAETLRLPLVELDWSRFQAPPAPAGLRMSVDSLAGTVSLAWNPVRLANLAHYRVARKDSADAGNDRTWAVADTVFMDTVRALPPGRRLIYSVAILNTLGNQGPEAFPGTVTVPVPQDTVTPPDPTGMLTGAVMSQGAPAASAVGVRVRLYAIPAAPGPLDSLPRVPKALDSALTGADGRYAFAALPAGRYTVTAETGQSAAIRIGLAPRAAGAKPDTLALAPTGSVAGFASRDSLWVTVPYKGDEGIPAALSGTPYMAFTGYTGSSQGRAFKIQGVPPGDYTLVVQAGPAGYFLPDSLSVKVASGPPTIVPDTLKARYNPNAPPPKIANLAVTASSRASVALAWKLISLSRYASLIGYRVLRLDSTSVEMARSPVLTAPAYTDDISALPSGTRIFYVVRVVAQDGREGGNGGDANGPIPFIVP